MTEFNEILARMLDRVPNKFDKREGSIIYDTLAPTAYILAAQNIMISNLVNLLFADTATGVWLDRVVNDFGMERELATNAVRQMTCTDNAGAPFSVLVGARFAINDLTFIVTEEVAVGTYRIKCEQTGTKGNSYSGALLPLDYISGLGAAVLEAEPIIPAQDDETDESLRARFYESVRSVPFGGNRADYREKAMAIDGVGECVVFTASDGMGEGNVGLMIGDDLGNKASSELVAKVQSMFPEDGSGLAVIGHNVSVATSTDFEVSVDVGLTLKTGTSIDIVAPIAKAAIESYIENMEFEIPTVFYAKVVSEVLNSHEAILDATVTVNGGAVNISLSKTFDNYQVPVIGTVTVTEAV